VPLHPHQPGLIFSIMMECTPEISTWCALCGLYNVYIVQPPTNAHTVQRLRFIALPAFRYVEVEHPRKDIRSKYIYHFCSQISLMFNFICILFGRRRCFSSPHLL